MANNKHGSPTVVIATQSAIGSNGNSNVGKTIEISCIQISTIPGIESIIKFIKLPMKPNAYINRERSESGGRRARI